MIFTLLGLNEKGTAMADPFSALSAAAIVIASLCMPPSDVQNTGYILVRDVVTIHPGHDYRFAGVVTKMPPIVEATIVYWAGTDTQARFLRFEGRRDQLLARVKASLPKLPGCVPVG